MIIARCVKRANLLAMALACNTDLRRDLYKLGRTEECDHLVKTFFYCHFELMFHC